jgi:hypothetical protein
MRVNIFTVPHVANSRALTPVLVNRRALKESGIDVRIFHKDTPDLYDADCVIFDGRVYRKWDGGDSEHEVAAFLDRLNSRVETVVWFDTTDGTGTTQFQFLPYVDKYLKLQVLKDRSLYRKSHYGGRFFTEYYHTEFGVGDTDEYPEMTPAADSDLHKIGVAWGHPMADYGRWAPWLRRIRRRILIPTWYTQRFVQTVDRTVDTSFRFGTMYRRETVAFQRQLVQKVADSLGFPTDKIPRPEYLKELRSCKVAVSPFGWGEPSYKDFEVIINGAALLKPDVSHMETWPNLYVAGETYLPFKWDCSDLQEVIDKALTGHTWRDLAQQARATYGRFLFGPEGREMFTDRFKEIVSPNGQPKPNLKAVAHPVKPIGD